MWACSKRYPPRLLALYDAIATNSATTAIQKVGLSRKLASAPTAKMGTKTRNARQPRLVPTALAARLMPPFPTGGCSDPKCDCWLIDRGYPDRALQRSSRLRSATPGQGNGGGVISEFLSPALPPETFVAVRSNDYGSAGVIDLFSDNALYVQPGVSGYLVTGPTDVVADIRFRSPEMRHEVRHLLRSLLSRFATARNEYAVVDATGAHRFDIVFEHGYGSSINMNIADVSGALVGTVATAGRSWKPFPKILLADGHGQPAGHMTTGGALHAYDDTNREVASVVVGTTKPAFGKARYELTFRDTASAQSKMLTVAGLVGWDLTRR